MASTFKNLSPNDKISTKTLLHEAIPITGTIVSGTYSDNNIKNYSHGMFQSVYDYPYLSSSANHIFDVTVGYSNSSALSASSPAAVAQQTKKINLYNQMAQVLVGYDRTGSVQQFDEDGNLTDGDKLNECIFLSFSRLLVKDEIKKGSFNLELGVNSDYTDPFSKRIKIIDESADTSFKVNSPVGEYGILVADSTDSGANLTDDDGTLADGVKCGLIFYQAGVAVLSGSVFGAAASAATATITVDDGDALVNAGSDAMAENQLITITSFEGVTKNYIIVDDTLSTVATGDAVAAGSTDVGSTTATNSGVAVTIATTGSPATQNAFLVQLKAAINSAQGHNAGSTDSKIEISAVPTQANGNQSITLTQKSATATHHLGNTTITETLGNVTATNFSGGGGGNGILSSSVGAPKMTSDVFGNSLKSILTGSSISGSADALRHRIYNLQFNNTVELNSSIYFCRINHNEYNYSANPTYLSSSQIRVKASASDVPVSYVTTVGLYSADNQLLAVGKLSEPLRKDPTIEYTLRARLDY